MMIICIARLHISISPAPALWRLATPFELGQLAHARPYGQDEYKPILVGHGVTYQIGKKLI